MSSRLLEVVFCLKEEAYFAAEALLLFSCILLYLLKPLVPPATAGEDVNPGVAGLRMSLPRHLAWFILVCL